MKGESVLSLRGVSERRPLSVLLLCDLPNRAAGTVSSHVNAFSAYSKHQFYILPMLGDIPGRLDLSRFDVIVVHYTLVASDNRYLSTPARRRIAASPALKAAFIQDEYRFVNRTVAAFRELGIDLLFTCVPDGEIEKVYPESALPGVRKINVLTGYAEPELADRQVPAYGERSVDVGYRSRKVPAWLGDLGQEKIGIGSRFEADAKSFGLVTDISCREETRLYGEDWIRFVSGCKAVLGVESGSSVFDFTGEIQAKVEADILANPAVSYETLRDRHFRDIQNEIRLNQISPRCFEAAALRTLMILYEGDYSGILEPWCHYVPLRKDHGNMYEVVAVLRDEARAQEIIDRAYTEVAQNPEYSCGGSIDRVDAEISDAHAALGRPLVPPYSRQEFRGATRPGIRTRWHRGQRRLLTYAHLVLFKYVLGFLGEARRERLKVQLTKWLRPVWRAMVH